MSWWDEVQDFFDPSKWNTTNLNTNVIKQTGLGGGGVAPYSLMTPPGSALQDYKDIGVLKPVALGGFNPNIGSLGPAMGRPGGRFEQAAGAGAAGNNDLIMGMTDAEFLQWLYGGGGGGGGGFNASIYDPLFEDLKARQGGIQRRYDANMADIESLYANAATARERDREAVNAAITQQLGEAQARRAQEMGATREAEAARLATYNKGREALGAAPASADMATKTVEGGLSRYSERGAAADRDQEIARSIANQQIQSELSGYTSAQELASRALSNTYEDRLAEIASQRSALRAQIAQQRAAAASAGGGGPSVSEKLAGLNFLQQMRGGNAEPIEFSDDTVPDVLGYFTGKNPANKPVYEKISNNISGYLEQVTDAYDPVTGKPKPASYVANKIVLNNPDLQAGYPALVSVLQSMGF